MSCNKTCNNRIQIGNKVRLNGSNTIYIILSFDILNSKEYYLILQHANGDKLFCTRNKFSVKCVDCPKRTLPSTKPR